MTEQDYLYNKPMIDLKPQLDNPFVRELLSFCIGFPTPGKLVTVCEQYRIDSARYLFGIDEDGQVIACIGFRLEQTHHARLHCIAVVPSHRHLGIGESLIKVVCAQFQLQSLTSETDIEAVGFYKHCGFYVTSLGEVYPGTERFRCELQHS